MTSAPTAALTTTATLTRIRLNRRSPAARRDLADAVSLHKSVMLLAPDDLGDNPRQQAGLLFRLEDATNDTPSTLLIQSHQPPDLTRLPRHYGSTETRPLHPMFQALTPGRAVRYRITANASAARRVLADHQPVDNKHGKKIVALYGDDALAWWQRRAQQAGLTLTTTDITPARFPRKRSRPADKPGEQDTPAGPVHVLTRFDGLATITDPVQLRHALLTGIGRGKPYGAGLLTLAPA
ncbi:type I-E CRISPR-associated protein Cas6/Cse3/CasE [Streptomyces sp. BK205]|uniref:type I-E CRISPR-associated protein Cas6/Cse3/CasE n=1 Tax=Streptomyces sp. BK205 TaxID=2512164 RepID=UPI00104B6734|nr:type I-E CRISPR-associated protein Cas6/Cse3/CasE [Streptomyces sp. BK205]TCR11400.1 CRISPR-associated Cse3 family protein [Streptomyces sp. BK205]